MSPVDRDIIHRKLEKIAANLHLLVQTGRSAPDDLYTSFIALGEAGVLDPAFASRIAPSAGLRNRLVHEYDQIDDAIVLGSVGFALEQ
jgi:uncharacterized protein YutE (UPF0331/DUF86 family)